jgi:hypothetical protein
MEKTKSKIQKQEMQQKQKIQQEALIKKKKRIETQDATIELKKSRGQLKKISKANIGFDKLRNRLGTELDMIKLRIKRVKKQLRLLNKKKEFLSTEIDSLKENKGENQKQKSVEKENIKKLK